MEDTINFKVILIGENSVGKTSLIIRYTTNKFNPLQLSTIGASFMNKLIKINNDIIIKFEIWDTAGQEKYRSVNRLFYQNAAACILVYDITRKSSFDAIKNFWIKDIKENIQKKASKKFYNFFSICFGWK